MRGPVVTVCPLDTQIVGLASFVLLVLSPNILERILALRQEDVPGGMAGLQGQVQSRARQRQLGGTYSRVGEALVPTFPRKSA